ncbi:hypothetical protein H1R17_01105 [Flavobacterium sp. xlx-214]|uniref:hypothetical protein n=1 Tax=unclassified Flavobacterium TaxID=196869 RepID=UPI0013D8A878|nr:MULTISPECIES: hypothetical protein [unclassified Flavobacterium]MBA5792617.1 hypothetical protein [Flavobacterium sp. xlx-221]QMI83766.1 hypothetical protein H1R17_01105 [Flavobacterium sp. xlx-214]
MKTNILFPAKVRKAAFALIILVFGVAILNNNFQLIQVSAHYDAVIGHTLIGLICLALFFIQFSKYPEDDEMLMAIRLKLALNALLVGIVFIIISPLMDSFVFNEDVKDLKAGQVMIFILLYQIVLFQMKRYSLKKELTDN